MTTGRTRPTVCPHHRSTCRPCRWTLPRPPGTPARSPTARSGAEQIPPGEEHGGGNGRRRNAGQGQGEADRPQTQARPFSAAAYQRGRHDPYGESISCPIRSVLSLASWAWHPAKSSSAAHAKKSTRKPVTTVSGGAQGPPSWGPSRPDAPPYPALISQAENDEHDSHDDGKNQSEAPCEVPTRPAPKRYPSRRCQRPSSAPIVTASPCARVTVPVVRSASVPELSTSGDRVRRWWDRSVGSSSRLGSFPALRREGVRVSPCGWGMGHGAWGEVVRPTGAQSVLRWVGWVGYVSVQTWSPRSAHFPGGASKSLAGR